MFCNSSLQDFSKLSELYSKLSDNFWAIIRILQEFISYTQDFATFFHLNFDLSPLKPPQIPLHAWLVTIRHFIQWSHIRHSTRSFPPLSKTFLTLRLISTQLTQKSTEDTYVSFLDCLKCEGPSPFPFTRFGGGTRAVVSFSQSLQKLLLQCKPLTFEKCSPALIYQYWCIPGLGNNSNVSSVLL